MTASAGADYSKLNKLLLLVGLVYFLWPQIRQALAGMGVQVPDLSRLLPPTGRPLTDAELAEIQLPPANTAPPGGGVGGGAIGAIGGVATSVIGAAAGGVGLGVGAAFAATGIGAAAAIIAWGVIKQGWFRGGQEALVVNPARDQFLAQFAPLDYLRDGRNPPGYYGLAWVLEAIAPGQGTGGAFAALSSAHTKDQLAAAVSTIQGLVAANQTKFAQLWEYARRDPSAPQRAVTPAAA